MYEYLAKTYFEPAEKTKPTGKRRRFFFLSAAILLGPALILLAIAANRNIPAPRPAKNFNLVLIPDSIKLNYNFNVAGKIESFDYGLNNLNAGEFDFIQFNVKKSDYNNSVNLRVEVINTLKERSEIYISGVPSRWKTVSLPLRSFNKITDWGSLSNLIFSIEEWNVLKKQGQVYIDDVKLTKGKGGGEI
ncbi:MAG: hypothetical protein PHR44_05350 [Candidatus Omnitrophica bacterium]|nr:hypothetical protein [Candidatus Omnitrophota bacterium]